MKIAVIGAGISGLACAYLLQDEHEVTVFEGAAYAGGHARTVHAEQGGDRHAVDTGFVVYNEQTYPNFVRLLERLGVETQPTSMSFSVRCERSGLEYCGSSVSTLFAQSSNLLRPSFYRMLADVLRFNRHGRRLLREGVGGITLGEMLTERRFSRSFVERYVVPMGSAIWSSSPAQVLEFPAAFFLRFFDNHGLLGVAGHLDWRVIRGGSVRYVEALTRSFAERIRLDCPVAHVRRTVEAVEVKPLVGPAERFDHVIFATHADQTLRLLADPGEKESEVLRAFPYQANDTILHTDAAMLPRRPRARASWNYHVLAEQPDLAVATYDMSRLQGLDTPRPFCVTLNRAEAIDPSLVVQRLSYAHPVFTPASIEAQRRHDEISGVGRTHFCGAYWGNGFHEDGVNSALAVCRQFGKGL